MRISVRAYLALRAVCVFDAVLLVICGVLLAAYMAHPAGLVGAGLCFVLAGGSIGAARWMDGLYRRR